MPAVLAFQTILQGSSLHVYLFVPVLYAHRRNPKSLLTLILTTVKITDFLQEDFSKFSPLKVFSKILSDTEDNQLLKFIVNLRNKVSNCNLHVSFLEACTS